MLCQMSGNLVLIFFFIELDILKILAMVKIYMCKLELLSNTGKNYILNLRKNMLNTLCLF